MARNLFAEEPQEGRNLFESEASATSPRMSRAQEVRDNREAESEAYKIPEIGSAPELNEMSVPAFKSSLALLVTGDTDRLKSSLSEQFGESVSFSEDDQGYTVVEFPSGRYALNKPGVSAQDIARGVFDVASFTPAGRAASVGGAVAKSAATQGAIEGAGEAVGAESDLQNVATAAALGGVGKGVENVVSSGVRAARGEVPQEQAELIAEGQRRDIPMMTSDVIKNETVAGNLAQRVGEAIPFIGTGQTRKAQQQAREAAIEDISAAAKPQYEEVVQSLKEQTDKVRRAAGNRLSLVTERMDEVGEIAPRATFNAIDEAISDLTQKGRVVDEQSLKELQRYRRALSEGQTFRSLDTLRSDFREAVKGERQSLPTRSEAMINKIYSAMTRDLKGSIESNLGKRSADAWSDAKGVYAREANLIKKSRLKSVLDKGDVTPESVGNVIFSQKPSEIRNLYRSLTPEGKEAMRGTIISRAVEKATNAEGEITPTALATQLGKLKKQTDIAFPGLKGKELKGLTDVLNATRRAQDSRVVTPTGQTVTGFAGGYAAFTDLATTAGFGLTAASLARAYESPLVRDALLRAGSLKKGTDPYDKAVSEAVRLITSFGQAAKEESARQAIAEEEL